MIAPVQEVIDKEKISELLDDNEEDDEMEGDPAENGESLLFEKEIILTGFSLS
jgi:hypothetical protein